ncbi:MAG: ferredoxin:CoB-CoM heterodisulfide reductase subunit HdrB [Methanobacteriaceae archaeon]|nr:ferredoxin:CoB-CoM heterodisulfide reductase subunit HdrB [Methanobacteriaceae archaeon]
MKNIPDKNILLFKSCMVNVEYPGVESSTKYIFDKLGIEYAIDPKQSCCTGLGFYYDLFDQVSTSALAARNIALARKSGHENIVTLCSTCYAILKKSINLLNSNEKARDEINGILERAGLSDMKYNEGDLSSENNVFHMVEILYSKVDEIAPLIKKDFSDIRIASHHACHYCKVYPDHAITGARNPMILDEMAKAFGGNVVDWYDFKKATCGAGFSQRFANRDLSVSATADKLLALEGEADMLLHMCPNCQMQLDRYQPVVEKEIGRKLNLVHLSVAQMAALGMGADPYKVLGIQTHSVPVEGLLEKIKDI